MLEKFAKIMGVLAVVAGVLALVLNILSQKDLSLFGQKTYYAEYSSGVYTEKGYISPFLDYEFTLPEGYRMSNTEERAKYSGVRIKGATYTEMEEALKNQNEILDMWVLRENMDDTYGSLNTMVSVQVNEKVSKRKLEECVKQFVDGYSELGITIVGDYELTELLGRKCGTYLAHTTLLGTKVNQRGYIFVENGYMWVLAVSYCDGLEAEAEKLLSAYKVYE